MVNINRSTIIMKKTLFIFSVSFHLFVIYVIDSN